MILHFHDYGRGGHIYSIVKARIYQPPPNRAVLRFNAFFGSSQRQPHTSLKQTAARPIIVEQVPKKGLPKGFTYTSKVNGTPHNNTF